MSNANNTPAPAASQTLNDFQSAQQTDSKFWRKVKADPIVPI
ncbi:unnamed protein product, partial [Rotaria magnacalcarata]